MLQFVCDYCASLKQTNDTWINGLAVENIGTRAARREVVIDPTWRYERVILPLAVHFCSVECKDNYLAELFDKAPSRLEVESVETEPMTGRRTIRAKKKPPAGSVQKRTTSRKIRLR